MSAVFVTGGTGFVGGAVLAALRSTGRTVKALARDWTSAQTVQAHGASAVVGDVFETDLMTAEMRGCTTVFHIAGVNKMCVADPSEMWRVNVGGSLNVIEAAAAAGVEKVVYTSSAATIGETHGVVATENSSHRGFFLSEYEKSKYEAEKAVVDRAESLGVPTVSVNPSSVQGPGRSTGSAQLLLRALNAPFAIAVDTHVSVVDIDDCAMAHLLAERHGVPGERYLVSGSTVTVRQALQVLREVTGASVPALTLPRPLVRAAGRPLAAIAQRRGSDHFCREMLDTLLHGHRYDATKSIEDLHMEYRSLDELLRRTVRWYVDYGFVHKSLPKVKKTA